MLRTRFRISKLLFLSSLKEHHTHVEQLHCIESRPNMNQSLEIKTEVTSCYLIHLHRFITETIPRSQVHAARDRTAAKLHESHEKHFHCNLFEYKFNQHTKLL